MKRINDLLIAVFVSPEFLALLVAIFAYTLWPEWLIAKGKSLQANTEGLKWLSLAPFAVLAIALRWASGVMFPNDPRADILAEWPDFFLVRVRVVLGVLYIVCGGAFTACVWLFGIRLEEPFTSSMYCAALVVSVVSAGTLWNASHEVRLRLRGGGRPYSV